MKTDVIVCLRKIGTWVKAHGARIVPMAPRGSRKNVGQGAASD